MIFWRLSAYVVLLAAMLGALVVSEVQWPGSLRLHVETPFAPTHGTSEYSAVEWLQLLMLAVIAALASICVRLQAQHRALAYLMLSLAVIAAIRELDFFLDSYLIDNSWQVLVALLLVGVAVYQYRHWKPLLVAWRRAAPSVGIALMLAGLAVLLVFAALFGHERFWQSLLGEHYRRVVKLAAEEVTELLGYWLWLVGQFEYLLQCLRQYRLAQSGDRRRHERRR